MTDLSIATPKRFHCRHIFIDGRRCASPALRGEEFCYYHHTSRSPVPNPHTRQGRRSAFDLPLPEDRSAIQHSIGEVLRRVASNEIDPRRAGLLLYGFQIASLNLPQARPALTQTGEQPLVEEVVADPNLGTVAPRSEILPIDTVRPNSLIARLLEDINRKPSDTASPPRSGIDAEPRPITLPNLQASAARPSLEGCIAQRRRLPSAAPASKLLVTPAANLALLSVIPAGNLLLPSRPLSAPPHEFNPHRPTPEPVLLS